MKFNYSGLQIKAGRRDAALLFSHPVTSLPAIAKNYVHIDIGQRNYSRELTIANKMLAFQNKEKEKRAAELIIANKELAFQNEEKENRAAELIIANKELAFQNKEKENRAAELIIANKELAFQNEEKENRAAELSSAYKELKKADEDLRGYIQGLEKMMFITSHKVRQPVCNILGIASVMDQFMNSPTELKKW